MKRGHFLLGLLLTGIVLAQGAALANPDVIRLHVVANSDDSHDQWLKQQAREALLEYLAPKLAQLAEHNREAFICNNLDSIGSIVQEELSRLGCQHRVQVRYGVQQYPPRVYGYTLFPAGNYRSLQVIIGAGNGDNWWCLLFPPLCFTGGMVEEQQTEEADGSQQEVRFWLWGQVQKLFAWLGRGEDE